jgi:hypothetical protein
MGKTKSISLMLATVLLIVLACNKNKNQPSNNTTTNSTNNPPSGPTPIPMTTQDSMLCGYWKLKKDEFYNNSVLLSTTNHNDSANCFIHLKSDEQQVGAVSAYRKCNNGIDCIADLAYWRVNTGKLELGALYNINSLTTNSLVLQLGSTSTQAHIYHFTK